jgi:hypothetical protein
MLDIIRRSGWSRPKPRPRRVAPAVRLTLERLEGRDLPAPLTPTGLQAVGVSASAISLTWHAPPDPSVTGYDVYEKIVRSAGGGKGSHGSITTYNLVAANVPNTFDTVSGLATGSSHDYLVKSVNATALSPYSNDAVGRTWIAPTLSPYVVLGNGTLWYLPTYGPVSATAGLTTEVTPYASGNPLTFAILAGPPTAAIDPNLGVIKYTPGSSEVGAASITIEASNALGNVTQTIPFNVAAYPALATPTVPLNSSSTTFNGQSQPPSATAVGSDGVTPVSGTFAFAYNGAPGGPSNVGTYQVLATFTSADPNYGNATLLTTYTINQAAPAFINLTSSPTIAVGTATTALSGSLTDTYPTPNPPAGALVYITINGVTQEARLDNFGNFSVNFPTASLPLGSYPITYTYAGATNFSAAADSTTMLTVAAPAAPQVTLNPSDVTVLEGYSATFTAAASGLPTPTVEWQVSSDGGLTFTNVTGATSPTLTVVAYEGMNRYHYRAVFTNPYGVAITTDAVLYVQSNDSGGD